MRVLGIPAYSGACLIPVMKTNVKTKENKMLKYIVAWLLGVPALLLIVIYFFMN